MIRELSSRHKQAGFACGCCGSTKDVGSSKSKFKVLLTGNPNCGKSTIFNKLSGLKVRTGNYPGVTVERSSGMHGDTEIIDTPGISAISSSTAEERIAASELRYCEADLIINIVDATTLERSLFLTIQLTKLGRPMVVLLNMWDALAANGLTINAPELEKKLGVRVIPFSAIDNTGFDELEKLLAAPKVKAPVALQPSDPDLKRAVEELASCARKVGASHPDFLAAESLCADCPEELKDKAEFVTCRQKVIADLGKNTQELLEAYTSDCYKTINNFVSAVQIKSDKKTGTAFLDKIVLNRFLSFPIFLLVMGLVYFVSVSWLGSIVTDWTNDELFGEMLQPWVEEQLTSFAAPDWLISLMGSGIIGGVGAVLGFVPQMIILFLMLTLLEQCGYMTRAAFVLDRIFALIGLSGRAFIPYLIGSGCGVPALMTARTLGSETERRLVLFTATMIPCGAKLPVIIVFAGAVFSDYPLFAPGMYILSIFVIMIAARILSKFGDFKAEDNPMLLEMPAWHVPSLKVTFDIVYSRCKLFVRKAGTIILGSVLVIWALTVFTFHNENSFISWIGEDGDASQSIMSDIAAPGAVLFEPIGCGTWQAFVASVAGLVAKENLVSTMATVTGFSSEEDEGFEDRLLDGMFGGDSWAAFAFVLFNLFTLPCFAAIGVMRRELGNRHMFFKAIGFVLAYSYAIAFMTYRLGLVAINGQLDIWTIIALFVALGFIYLLFIKRGPAVSEKISFVMAK